MIRSFLKSLTRGRPSKRPPLVPGLQTGLSRQFSTWGRGLDSEIAFWEEWFRTRGGQWPSDFVLRQDPSREIEARLVEGLLPAAGSTLSVLDVGAGPMTRIGPRHGGLPFRLVAVDPLAPFYDALADRNGVVRPVVTKQGFAEDLTAAFGLGEFDLVYCSNALDHSFDPIRGIEEMLLVTRLGGRVVLEHYVNEAAHGEWDGLHQWNFDEEAGHFIVWNRERRVDASALFGERNKVHVEKSEKHRTIRVTFERTAAMEAVPGERARGRVLELLGAALLAFQEPQAEA